MSKEQDLKELDEFMEFIKKNEDVRERVLEMLNRPYEYIFDPKKDGNTERPTLRQSLTMQRLMLKNRESNSTNNGNTKETN